MRFRLSLAKKIFALLLLEVSLDEMHGVVWNGGGELKKLGGEEGKEKGRLRAGDLITRQAFRKRNEDVTVTI